MPPILEFDEGAEPKQRSVTLTQKTWEELKALAEEATRARQARGLTGVVSVSDMLQRYCDHLIPETWKELGGRKDIRKK